MGNIPYSIFYKDDKGGVTNPNDINLYPNTGMNVLEFYKNTLYDKKIIRTILVKRVGRKVTCSVGGMEKKVCLRIECSIHSMVMFVETLVAIFM